ncbi:MAG: glycosyltransferase [Phormidesmis sp.]
MALRLLLLSTPVGPLGSGRGGGVELTVVNLAQVLVAQGHRVVIAAPVGSVFPFPEDDQSAGLELVQIPGTWQPTAQHQDPIASAVTSSALANAWEYAHQAQQQYDLLVNFAYDWLPFYLTPFLSTPVAHFVSMGSLRAGKGAAAESLLERAMAQTSLVFPGTLGSYTRSQADTFGPLLPAGRWQILGGGLNISDYNYCDHAGHELAWVGRISPEKGLEDAVAAAVAAGQPLKIFGQIEDTDYWRSIQRQIAQADVAIDYCGFLPTSQLQTALGKCSALLVTPHWVEAFGLVAIEALACGVPVIAYQRGGPAEIVRSGKTGWLVAPDDIEGLVGAIAHIDQISRADCRQQAETLYSLPAWGTRFEQWFYRIISSTIGS